ncbi:MAG: tetratricopeptide repeat protein [Candidatus Eremiobacteraeota bacterium]|nr:tetratricopeptide repeat protein [Candidatus Eremiobacteraeota bacterium]
MAGASNGKSYIDTIAGRGYRFVAPVRAYETDAPAAASIVPIRVVRRPRPTAWPFAALAIVAALTLHSSAPSSVTPRVAVSPQAQRYYILGRHYWSERTSSGLRQGLRYFQSALHINPSFAQAYSGLADSYSAMGYYADGVTQRRHYYDLSEDAARRAIAIDPSSAEAHASLAFVVHLRRKHVAEAGREFEQSIALNPEYATAREWYSWFLYSHNRPDEALAQMSKARDLDPLSPIINYALGYQLFYQRRFKESAAQWHQTISIAPFSDTSYYGAGLADEQTGQLALALSELRRAYALQPKDPDIMGALAHVYATTRHVQEAQRLLKRIARMTPMPAYNMAVVSAALGKQDAALKWLRIAKAEHDPTLESFFDMDPRFDRLRKQYRNVTASSWS